MSVKKIVEGAVNSQRQKKITVFSSCFINCFLILSNIDTKYKDDFSANIIMWDYRGNITD